MSPYPESWYIAAETRELKSRPLSREVAETPLVLFRDHRGIAHALFDRCPHRNVQLSKGKVVKGRLQCPYHGWEFSGEGVCEHIPALPEGTHIPARACTRRPHTRVRRTTRNPSRAGSSSPGSLDNYCALLQGSLGN